MARSWAEASFMESTEDQDAGMHEKRTNYNPVSGKTKEEWRFVRKVFHGRHSKQCENRGQMVFARAWRGAEPRAIAQHAGRKRKESVAAARNILRG